MGYTRHNAVIATLDASVFDRDTAPDVEGFRASLPEPWRRLVIGPVQSIVNSYVTFAFLPDGSKEGWPDSDEGDAYRERFVGLFNGRDGFGTPVSDVVVVEARYGRWLVVGEQITDAAARELGGNPDDSEGAVIVPGALMDAALDEALELGRIRPELWARMVTAVLASQPRLAAVTVEALQAGILASNERLLDRIEAVSMGLYEALNTKRGQARRDGGRIVKGIEASALQGTPWSAEMIEKEGKR